jgi:hypothetical protein
MRTYEKHPLIREYLNGLSPNAPPRIEKAIQSCIQAYNDSFTSKEVSIEQLEKVKNGIIRRLWGQVPFLRNDLHLAQQFKHYIHLLDDYLDKLVNTVKTNKGHYVIPNSRYFFSPTPINFNDDV